MYSMGNEESKTTPQFSGKDQREGLREASQNERETAPDENANTEDELSLGDSVHPYGEVSGTTVGMESNTAKFSNIGQKNQVRKGESNMDRDAVNQANRQQGNGGTGYSDYLNQAQNQFLSSTGAFDQDARQQDKAAHGSDVEGNDNQLRPFDAMQGRRENSSGTRS